MMKNCDFPKDKPCAHSANFKPRTLNLILSVSLFSSSHQSKDHISGTQCPIDMGFSLIENLNSAL